MTDPNDPFDGELALLEELRNIHAADHAPEAFKQRAIAAACGRSWALEPLARSSLFAHLRELYGRFARWLAAVVQVPVPWARASVAMALLVGVAVGGELWSDAPDAAIVLEAEPETPLDEHAGDEHAWDKHSSPGQRGHLGSASGAAASLAEAGCPQNVYPDRPPFAPASTDPDARRAGVTVHTFEQETRSCGPVTRRYLEYVPEGVPLGRAPVVLILHGGPDRAEGMRSIQTRGRFEALAKQDHFIAVYASAVPSQDSDPSIPHVGRWQLGAELERQVDDEAYLIQVVADMQQRGVIAGNNDVFLVGHGEGALMALNAAAHRPDLYSGVAALMLYAVSPLPKLEANARLSRVLFISLGDDVRSLVHDWALALGISHKVIEKSRAVPVADRTLEGNDYAGDSPLALRSRSSHVRRVDLESTEPHGPMIRALFVSPHAGYFVPMPEPDGPELARDFGFRNQDVDAVNEAWSFLQGALEHRH